MDIELVPGSVKHLEKLVEGSDAFLEAYGLRVIDGYLPFEGALQYILNQMQAAKLEHPWLPYLFLFRPDAAIVGFGGFKSIPDSQRTVEIGYSVAPSYQERGFATSAARQLIEIAFESKQVDCVYAHTLAERNASVSVLTKCGMTQVSERIDPEIGTLWKWEIRAE